MFEMNLTKHVFYLRLYFELNFVTGHLIRPSLKINEASMPVTANYVKTDKGPSNSGLTGIPDEKLKEVFKISSVAFHENAVVVVRDASILRITTDVNNLQA